MSLDGLDKEPFSETKETMDEPSVLDFILDKLTFWKKDTVSIPAVELDEKPVTQKIPAKKKELKSWQGLLTLIPLLLAIIAQVFCEPDQRSAGLAIFFYTGAAVGQLLLVFFRNWELSPLVQDQGEAGDLKFRWVLFVIGAAFCILAFLFFLGNLFNFLNTGLWVIGLVLVWWSIWTPENWWEKIKAAFDRFRANGIQISPWGLLVIGVFLLAGLYRLYRLDQVPPEMFSDHAEKLIDVTDVLRGNYLIFFPRNTGREAFQMYLTAATAKIFGTGISFMSLKLGTGLMSLFALPFIYLLGKEIKSKEVGLLAIFFAGIAYWPNVISRVALRFTLYPAFVAPTLYFLVRGLRRKRWNDFLFAGLALGIGLHGYSTFRIVPLVLVATLLIYFLHSRSFKNRRQALFALVLVALISLIIFLPLMRFALSNYDMFTYRMRSRLTNAEHPLPGSFLGLFFTNFWKALIMFQWDNGQIWVHSIPGRPALGVFTAALFSLGVILVAIRYLRYKNWMDLNLLVWIPLLLLPSILSIAFPEENPSLNRSGGAIIPVFLIVGFAVENLVENLKRVFSDQRGKWISWSLILLLAVGSLSTNATLVFEEYYQEFKIRAWNTSEIGQIIGDFSQTIGDEYRAWVIPYPHWVDTRLVGIRAIGQVRDYALWQSDIQNTSSVETPKLYIYKPEDQETQTILNNLYPDGILKSYHSDVVGRDFILYYVLE
jgi:hypothetical protein